MSKKDIKINLNESLNLQKSLIINKDSVNLSLISGKESDPGPAPKLFTAPTDSANNNKSDNPSGDTSGSNNSSGNNTNNDN